MLTITTKKLKSSKGKSAAAPLRCISYCVFSSLLCNILQIEIYIWYLNNEREIYSIEGKTMNKNKNFVAALTFFVITSALTFLWWNVAISQAWLNRIASREEILWSLRNNEGSVNAKNHDGWTGLMIAADLGDLERTQLLLQYKADPNIRSDDLNKGTALHMLCRKSFMTDRNVAIMKLLLDNGANVHALDIYGREPLHWIGGIGDPHFRTVVLDLLMRYGANLNARDVNGDTPLNVMIDLLWSRETSWFKEALFDKYGAKIDPAVRNKKGETSLDYARSRRYIPLIKVLCSTGKWSCTARERAGFFD